MEDRVGHEQHRFFQRGGVAIKGYDMVAYFEEGRAMRGSKKYTFNWNGLEWRFSSSENLQRFQEQPDSYEPQFGGFCAFGASQGYKASVRPKAFTIADGKLYLNFARYVQRRWKEDQEMKILAAERKWEETKGTHPIKAHPIPIWFKYQFMKLFGKDLFS